MILQLKSNALFQTSYIFCASPALQVELCKRALIRALREHRARLLRQVLPADAAALRTCTVDAAAARRGGVAAQVALTRALKLEFAAELTLAVKTSEKVGAVKGNVHAGSPGHPCTSAPCWLCALKNGIKSQSTQK